MALNLDIDASDEVTRFVDNTAYTTEVARIVEGH